MSEPVAPPASAPGPVGTLSPVQVESLSDPDQPADAPPVSTQEYLETEVMDVLTQALEDVCRVRPANPVDYVALYLLRRSTVSNPVEVPFSVAVPQPAPKAVES